MTTLQISPSVGYFLEQNSSYKQRTMQSFDCHLTAYNCTAGFGLVSHTRLIFQDEEAVIILPPLVIFLLERKSNPPLKARVN